MGWLAEEGRERGKGEGSRGRGRGYRLGGVLGVSGWEVMCIYVCAQPASQPAAHRSADSAASSSLTPPPVLPACFPAPLLSPATAAAAAYYDPKSRSMREDPNPEKDPSQKTFYGDNFVRQSGEVGGFKDLNVFAITTHESGRDVHMQVCGRGWVGG